MVPSYYKHFDNITHRNACNFSAQSLEYPITPVLYSKKVITVSRYFATFSTFLYLKLLINHPIFWCILLRLDAGWYQNKPSQCIRMLFFFSWILFISNLIKPRCNHNISIPYFFFFIFALAHFPSFQCQFIFVGLKPMKNYFFALSLSRHTFLNKNKYSKLWCMKFLNN